MSKGREFRSVTELVEVTVALCNNQDMRYIMKFEVNLPDFCCEGFTEHDIKVCVAAALHDKDICALGYAAEAVGISKRELIEEMGKFGVIVCKMSVEDAERRADNAIQRAEARKRKNGYARRIMFHVKHAAKAPR
jgi:hypothetical protein